MTLRAIPVLTIAAALGLFPGSLFARQAGPASDPASANTSPVSSAGQNEAKQMVPASAVLLDTLDARKLQPGSTFKAQLAGKVHLANGPELPSGTILIGTVTQDDMNLQGNSKLAMRFTSAQLKDGSEIPVKAMIVGIYASVEPTVYNGYTAGPPPNDWNHQTLGVDQVGAISGVDLHSRADSQNSGVLVATTKDDVKVNKGDAISLAIAETHAPAQNSSMRSAGKPSGL